MVNNTEEQALDQRSINGKDSHLLLGVTLTTIDESCYCINKMFLKGLWFMRPRTQKQPQVKGTLPSAR